MHSRIFRLPAFGLAVFCGIGLSWEKARSDENAFGGRHVLVVGIDGCRPDSLVAAAAPRLHALMANGSFTLNAFAGGKSEDSTLQATSSGPGWSSILTGVWRNKHGVSNNDFTGERYSQYPHFFKRVKETEPLANLSSIVSWNPIDSAIVGPVTDYTDYRTRGIGANYMIRDQWVRDDAIEHLQSADPDVLFLHFDQVDGAGHASGYRANGSQYLQAIANVDDLIGDVLDAIDRRPDRNNEEWLTIVTTDHGGIGTGHGGQTDEERTIFFITSGDTTVRREFETSPGHTAVPPTVFKYLGLPIDKDWGWEEAPFGLPPYPPSNFNAQSGLDRAVVLSWTPPEEVDADQIVLKRNGVMIAELPLDSTHYIDVIPENFFAIQLVYTLAVAGSAIELPVLEIRTDVVKNVTDDLLLHWPLDGNRQDVSEFDHIGETHGSTETIPGAYSGMATLLGSENESGSITTILSEDLQFERFTNFAVGIWVRPQSEIGGSILTNHDTGNVLGAGWNLLIEDNGSLKWEMRDGSNSASIMTTADTLPRDRWHHVAVSVERQNNACLYVDGIQVGSANVRGLRSVDGSGPVELGDSENTGFSMAVDDLRIWNRQLSVGEWRSIFEYRTAALSWRENQFNFSERFDTAIGAWEADPDADGRTNLMEFALRSDPRSPDTGSLIRMKNNPSGPLVIFSQLTGGAGDPVAAYRIRGVVHRLEKSSNLESASWRPIESPQNPQITYNIDGTHQIRWNPPRTKRHLFYRIRFTLNPDGP